MQHRAVGRVQFHEHALVAGAQELADQGRRARIDRGAVARPDGRHRRAIGGEQRLGRAGEGRIEPADAIVPLPGAPGLVGGEVVEAEPAWVSIARNGVALRWRCASTRVSTQCLSTSAWLPAWKAWR